MIAILVAGVAAAVFAAPQGTRIIILEDFESYTNTESLRAAWPGGTAELATGIPGGGNAARHDGGDLNNSVNFSIRPDGSNVVVFSADFYDSATNYEKRVTIALRNTSGANLEMGYIYEQFPYALRIVGFAGGQEWESFDPTLEPVRGWNRFQAIVSLTNTIVALDVGADGKIEKVLNFNGPGPTRPFTSIRFGGLPGRISHGGPVLIDNIRLALEPKREELFAALVEASKTASAPNTSRAPVIVPPGPLSPPAPAVAPEPSAATVPAPAVVHTQTAALSGPPLWWIVGALVVIIVLLGALLIFLRRAPTPVPTVPALLSSSATPDGKSVRDQAVAELAEFAKQSLVQGLYSQRMALLEIQQKARQEILDLEARLGAMQLPLQDRIRAYEKRIAELEKELETRGDEMRELTQVTIRLVRAKLEEEKERERSSRFN